ncbi:uncharacterized protein ISCGN_028130 [Ixodes scapularis]
MPFSPDTGKPRTAIRGRANPHGSGWKLTFSARRPSFTTSNKRRSCWSRWRPVPKRTFCNTSVSEKGCGKYIYRLVLDLDCQPDHPVLIVDDVVSRAGKGAQHRVNRKRFDAASAYEYVNSVTYNVDVESDDVTVEDRGAVEYNQGVGVVSERGSDEEMDEDSVLHPHDEGFGKVEVDESGSLEIIYPTGTPSSPGENVVENSLTTCIKLAKAYDGIYVNEEDEETSRWLLKELAKGFGLKRFVYSEYIKRLLETNKICTLMLNKGSGRYDLFKYNETTGTMMPNEPSTLLSDLETVAIKTCFKFESWREDVSPFNLCYEVLLELTNQRERKLDFSKLHRYLQSGAASTHSIKLTSNRHLVLPNGDTYDLYDKRYVAWSPDQVCTVRSECDLTLGVGEKVDHYYVEVLPTRGGFRYRCQLLCKTIENAWSVFKNNKLGHEVFAVIKAMSDRVFKKRSKFSDPEEFMDNFLKEMCRESPPKKF